MIAKQSVKVFNYNPFPVSISGIHRGYLLEGNREGRPVSETILMDDVEHINNQCNVFRSGLLEFEASEADEIHETLHNTNWRVGAILHDDIEDFILNPTYEKMARIITLQDISTLERFRGALIRIKAIGEQGVSGYVDFVINERCKELNRNMRASQIQLQKAKFEHAVPASDLELETLRKQYADLRAQLDTLLTQKVPETPEQVETKIPTPAPAPRTIKKKSE